MTNWADTPEGAIARLDDALARRGEDAVLRRVIGTEALPVDVKVRAQLRGYEPQELIGTIVQGDSKAIISPTEIERAQWPGARPSNSKADKRVPLTSDMLIVQGRPRAIKAAAPIYMQGQLVRIELQVKG